MTQETNTLYHYIHCPFCIRVRMAFGLLNIPYQSQVLPYDDEETPLSLAQTKMLPIVKFNSGEVLNESLDIITEVDKQNRLKLPLLTTKAGVELNESLLPAIGESIHSLCMPYWIYTPEFNEKSRAYFQTKKEKKRGPFYKLIQNKQTFLSELGPLLKQLENKLKPFYLYDHLTIFDIMISSHLWGLYIFPEFQFSTKLHNYLQTVKKQCSFEYHEDYWKNKA